MMKVYAASIISFTFASAQNTGFLQTRNLSETQIKEIKESVQEKLDSSLSSPLLNQSLEKLKKLSGPFPESGSDVIGAVTAELFTATVTASSRKMLTIWIPDESCTASDASAIVTELREFLTVTRQTRVLINGKSDDHVAKVGSALLQEALAPIAEDARKKISFVSSAETVTDRIATQIDGFSVTGFCAPSTSNCGTVKGITAVKGIFPVDDVRKQAQKEPFGDQRIAMQQFEWDLMNLKNLNASDVVISFLSKDKKLGDIDGSKFAHAASFGPKDETMLTNFMGRFRYENATKVGRGSCGYMDEQSILAQM